MIAFISYCLRDLALVEPLVIQLGILGYDVQFEGKMPTAQIRWPHVLDSIKNADVFVLAVTPTSIHSYSRGIEVRYAKALGKPIVAALLADVYEEIPSAFIPTLDFRPSNISANDDLASVFEMLNLQHTEPLEADQPDWLSPLRKLRTIITNQRIKGTNQAVVLLNLSEMFERQETYHAAESLLELFAARTDLQPEIRHGVDEIVASINQSYVSQRRARWLNAVLGAVALSVMVAALIFFLTRSLANRPPASTPTTVRSIILPVEDSELVAAAEATQEPVDPTDEVTETTQAPTDTVVPTLSSTPTASATQTPLPPSATFTATLLPLVIVTTTPAPTNTHTPLPPTATFTNTTAPSRTSTATLTLTASRTPTSTASATRIPPTPTYTPSLDLGQIFGSDIYVGIIVIDTPQGVEVAAVGPTAALAGVQVGDYVVAVDLELIETAAEFQREMNRRNPFARVDIRMRRGNLYSAIMTLGFADYIIPTATTGAAPTRTISAPVSAQ